MAKKLLINCASCDARKLQEENCSAYESITVNAATVLASEASKAVMNRLPFALNCANVIEVEGDVDLRTVNGKAEYPLKYPYPCAHIPAENTVLFLRIYCRVDLPDNI